jgi:hypothetical protein
MSCAKYFGILVDGWGEGWARSCATIAGIAEIAVIAEIARHRRDRKGKTPPRMNTDDTDQETGGCDGHRWD